LPLAIHSDFYSPPTKTGKGIMFFGRSSVRPLTPILRDAIVLYLVEGFQRNLAHHVIEHCWKGFQGQRWKVKVVTRQIRRETETRWRY